MKRIEWKALHVVIVDDGILMKRVFKKRHVRSSHTSQPPFSCDQCGRYSTELIICKHMRNCTGLGVAVPTAAMTAAKKHCTGVAPEILQFKLQKTCEALKGSVQQFTVNMKEAKSHNIREGYSCGRTSNDGFPTEASSRLLSALFSTKRLIQL